jgi:acyl-CoA thioesterase-1
MSEKDISDGGTGTAAADGNDTDRKKFSPLPADAVIVAFGDSLTFGTGAATEHNYPSELERLVSRRVVNAGVPGEDTEKGLRRLPLVLDKYRPSLVILCHGANDLKQGFGDLQASENIRKMIRICRDRGVPVVLLGIPYPTLFTSKPPFYAMIAQEFSVPFAPDAVADVLADPSLKSDSIHPNARGYIKIAEAIADILRQSGIV